MTTKTKQIVINSCYGGFGLSEKAIKRLKELAVEYGYDNLLEMINNDEIDLIDRDNPLLIRVIEELGDDVDGRYSNLRIVEIPADVEWEIEEHDGWECVVEKHREWC